MVIIVTFRHHTQNDELKKSINKHCIDLQTSFIDITSLHVAFSVVSHKNKLKPLIQCHLSAQVAHQKNVEIFDENTKLITAYYQAYDRLSQALRILKPASMAFNNNHAKHFQQIT